MQPQHLLSTFALLLASPTVSALTYTLQTSLQGPTFFDAFAFQNTWDPTFGYVHYVDRPTAESFGMINAVGANTITTSGGPVVFGAEHTRVLDPAANLGRPSVKLVSKETWTRGLFVLDLEHMPANVCGSWPAFWMLGSGGDGQGVWPKFGEIDIIEYINDSGDNLMALHTAPGCTVAGAGQTGTLLTNDCGKDGGFAACGVAPTQANNSGTSFNANGGGVYAMEWTSAAVQIWFFPRQNIPSSLVNGDPSPDTSTFGVPSANFQGSCDIDTYFSNASMIFDIDFCGSYAGPLFNHGGCPVLDPTNEWTSCNKFVAANPQAYVESYWAVNYLNVYQAVADTSPVASSSLSSVTPAASSTAVTASGAEGRSSTPSGTINAPSSATSVQLPATSVLPPSGAVPTPIPSVSSVTSLSTTPPPAPPPSPTTPTAVPTTQNPDTSPVIVVETTIIYVTTTVSVAPNRVRVQILPSTLLVTKSQ
ncbi:unnamed protein product [Zymoseptoria tritici ST99CH_1E4]|uniref:GH16 domain-containing protein n=1 Tax=Zymoseptoria tritici ST99CH_1E4 TaxID=1276532 RepID=A0A2H1FLY4_ZYMTR|nr:unnamed protein product [Zymoseptoria tritici ST99CH_1E4]